MTTSLFGNGRNLTKFNNEIERDRFANAISAIVKKIGLDLHGLHVLTEAATGPYMSTPVIAAFAGANVVAFTKATRYGSVAHVRRETMALAKTLRIERQIEIIEELTPQRISSADIVTNSGHLRPIDAAFIVQMKPGAVIPLMYENWEFRSGDVDITACRARGIPLAGTNERHPHIAVFDYLGLAALYGLIQCRVPPMHSRLLLVADNPFVGYVAKTLLGCGAQLEILGGNDVPPEMNSMKRSVDAPGQYDAVIVAEPGLRPIIGRPGEARYNTKQIGRFFALVQIYGDVDRDSLGPVVYCPQEEPLRGHMGINLSQLGPEPVIRLQAGGLKVGQVMTMGDQVASELTKYCQPFAISDAPGETPGQAIAR